MKRFLPLILIFVLFAPSALAHGGVERRSGPIIAYYTQEPLSPLVGETVRSTFVLRDDTGQNLANWPVTLTLIDTFYGDESKDTQLLARRTHTDTNGSLAFEYIFPKENYFDLDIELTDRSGNEQTIGFLIQPRDAVEKVVWNNEWMTTGLVMLTLIGTCAWIARRLKRRFV